VIVALSGGQKLALLVVAGIFIGFALASSFLFPRANPDFPGERRLPLFVAASVALLVAMLTAMVVFARESEGGGHEAAPTETAHTTTAAATQPSGGGQGDPAAGKQVFASAGCEGCHTLKDAGSNGKVGPNLDQAKPSYALVVDRVTHGKGGMPSFKGRLSDKDIQNVAAYVSSVAGKS
jgi:mono/diheme cytochrome c family protein